MLNNNYSGLYPEAGVDEAGRGCLAGPVVAAAVIFPNDYQNHFINDSKKLTRKKRDELRDQIEKDALSFSVAFVDNREIDRINILQASFLAMHKSINGLTITPNFLIIDGNRFNPYPDIPHMTIVKGDSKFLSIAAASILAKTYRDEYMEKIHFEFPDYGWQQNMGYATQQHIEAYYRLGLTPYHRKSFHLKGQLSISFDEIIKG